MTSHRSQVPAVAAAYFARLGVTEHPLISQVFTPAGWKRPGCRKRVSGSAIRRLRSEGVTHVALSAGGHVADFTAAELCRNGAK